MGEEKNISMDENDGDGNPSHSHSNYVPMILCAESRAHMETKIDNMEESIKSTIKTSIAVGGFILALLQLVIHFWG